jgi:hypothetical protein
MCGDIFQITATNEQEFFYNMRNLGWIKVKNADMV